MKNNGEVITYFTDKDLPGILFMDAKNSNKKWTQLHETYSFCHADANEKDYSENIINGKSYVARKNSILFVEPGDYHCVKEVTGYGNYKVVIIDKDLFIRNSELLHYRGIPHLKSNLLYNNYFANIFKNFYQTTTNSSLLLEKQSLFTNCVENIYKLIIEKQTNVKKDCSFREVDLVKNYIREFYNRNISIDELSNLTSTSKFHLIRTFRKKFGIPPHKYQIYLLIKNICDEIHKGKPINILFFTDQSHFINCFKRIMGVTPNQYSSMVTGKRLIYN